MRNKEIVLKGNRTMGFSLNDVLADIFGEENVDALKTQAQNAGTALILNQTGQYVQANPDAVKAITNTGQQTVMDTLAQVWAEYKIPVIIGGVLVTGALAYGIYSMIEMNKVTSKLKSNPQKKSSKRRK